MKNSSKSFFKYNLINNFRSPSFYIITILFSVFTFINFFIRYEFFTGKGSSDLLLLFSSIPYISIIAIPSLCYKSSFSNYDNFVPLSNIKKLFIKFLSILVLYTLMLLLLLPAVFIVNIFGNVDFGQVFTSYFTLVFYGSAVISLCLLINEICRNKITSFIVSAVVLAIFNSAHLFTVYINLPPFLITLFKQLSFAWHFDAAGKGIIDTRDILWLLSATALFLLLAAFTIDLKKGRKLGKRLKFSFSSSLLIIILVMLNGNRIFTRIDLSKSKIYSPSSYTKELVSKINLPVKITYYRSSKMAELYPQIRDVSDFLTTYTSLNKNISLIIKDPDKDKESATLLKNYGIQSQQIRNVTSTSAEFINVYSAIVIEYNGNAEVIPFTMAADTLEYDLDGRIKHLLTGIPRIVNIVVGNGMDLDKDYGYLEPWLNANGFIVNNIKIKDPEFTTKLNNSTGPLFVIGDSEIKIDNAIAIESYILNNKGNALFTVSPFSSDIEETWNITSNRGTNIIEILENWGVTFTDKIAGDISCSRITMISEDRKETHVLNYPLWINLLPQENTNLGCTVFWPVVLELQNENVKPYLYTTNMSYTFDIDKSSPNKLIESDPFLLDTINTNNFLKSTNIVAAQITGPLNGYFNLGHTENSDIVVIADQYFVNSLMNGYIGGKYGDYRNYDFVTKTLLELNGETELAQLQSRALVDKSLSKISDGKIINQKKTSSYITLFGLIPLFVIVVGVIFNVRKQKKHNI